MATEKQGIMSLPQGGEKETPQMPQMGLEDSYDAVKGGLQDVSPQASAAMQQTLDQITPQLDQLSDEQLDAMIQLFQYLHDHPEEYEERVKELVSKGVVDQGTMPDKYDPEVLATLIIVFMEAKKQRQMGNEREAQMAMPQPPATMARGGIAEAARMVASKGRSGDSMLAHITPKEAKMLRKHGGMGTINPATGLPEYGFFSSVVGAVTGAVKSVVGAVTSVVSSVVNTVKTIVQSPVGKILGTIALAAVLGPTALGATLGTAGTAALSAGTITALGGGNLKDVLRSAATSYLGAPGGPVESFLGNAGAAMGVTNAAGQAAINAGLTGAGVGLLTGQSLKDSVKSGLIAGAIQGGITGTKAGFGAQAPGIANAPTGESVSGKWNSETGRFETPTPSSVQRQMRTGAGNAPSDPLGDFMQQNERLREMAGTPAVERGAAPLQPVPTVGQSLTKIGGGIADMAQGNFSQGFETAKGGLGDLLMPSSKTTAQLTNSDVFQNARAQGASYTEALKAASDAYNPSLLRTYGPGVVAGLAATGAMGGFSPSTPPSSELATKLSGTPSEDLIRANPRKYITQNLPGVQYDSMGNIIGSTPWQPPATMADVRVPANSMGGGNYHFGSTQPPMGSMYTPGQNTLGQQRQIYQPYNTAGMYGNLMSPGYADGGMIEQPVQHRFFGGMMEALRGSIGPEAQAVINAAAPAATTGPSAPAIAYPIDFVGPRLPSAAQAGTPATPAAPIALARPDALPAAAATQQAFTPQLGGPSLPVQAPAQTAQVGPGLPAVAAPVADLDTVRVRPGQHNPMSAEMRDAFARQFAQNLGFTPRQEVRQPQNPVLQRYNNMAAYSNFQQPTGGLASLAEGGYPRRTGQISGPGTETSDSIPAMLSDGEFVMTAKAVRGAGKGSRRAGAKKMYALMHQLERNASRG